MEGLGKTGPGGLLGLPAEVKVSVLSFALGNSYEDILSLAGSCKTLYETFKMNQPSILLVLLCHIAPRDLAIATAHYHATVAPWKCSKFRGVPPPPDVIDYLCKVTNFCEQYLSKQGTELRIPLREFTLPMVAHIRDIHEAIRAIAQRLAPEIVQSKSDSPDADPSPVEIANISKSLYIIDLVGLLFPKRPVHELHAFTKFWSCFAPWEAAQAEHLMQFINRTISISAGDTTAPTTFLLSSVHRFILWKGMKGLVPLICHGYYSQADQCLYGLFTNANHAFGPIRDEIWQERHHWFNTRERHVHNKYTVYFNREPVERYNADIDDGAARIWLWIIRSWATTAVQDNATFTQGHAWYTSVYNKRERTKFTSVRAIISMASNTLKCDVSVNETSAHMNLDIWHLILGQMDRSDLCNVCLTSRAWFVMAMPHLYKIIPLALGIDRTYSWDYQEDIMVRARSLSSRLLDPKNGQLRNAVHELDFGPIEWDDSGELLRDMERRLVTLIDVLPNLQRVKIRNQLTPEVFRDLVGHSKRISLHLLCEDGTRIIENDLQTVVTAAAIVNPFDESNGPNRHVLGIQKLLFACPNLTSFSLEFIGGYGGCVMSNSHFGMVQSFQFSGDETFPALEELSLSGYQPSEAEREHWQKRFRWSKLRSLTIGPRYTAGFLKIAAGFATSLRNLHVQLYTDADSRTDCPQLEHLLMAFASLESLVVKGYHLPPGPIGNHPGLKRLCLHSFEPVIGETLRPTLSIEQLHELDKNCAHLETLELDLSWDGEWPEQILKALATGFRNLRRLTLHLELGLKDVKGWRTPGAEECMQMGPILTKDSAKEVGQQFFKWRSSSSLSVLVLKTGEPLRRYPQWEPPYSVFERMNGNTMEVYKPWNTGGVPEVAIMARHGYYNW
ncbi:hypothetical protein E0Z10_g4568 [Xylaria hypoxylon]|uniref:F-box domain-containing protein n=1 Tax=Xylaria hypoxylon TaxID=37992 RepID=A0A4Z0YJZ4_9PEZI|nr:hypothetical protein E0Z10_g4568 [Xylaria hypoxylon]